jgi:hypothetical protein
MPTFATPGPIAATVEVAGARVRVSASDRTDTVVLVEPVDGTNRKDVRVAEKTTVDFAGGRLSVKTTVSGDKDGSVAIAIDLPTGSSLAAYLAYADVQTDGPLAGCELHMASGRVRLERVDALTGNVAGGAVAVGRVAGRADIEGGAFDLRIGEVEGPVALSNASGRAWIGHAFTDFEIASSSGDVDIERADGSVTATTAGGAVRIGRMTHGHAKLMTGSGNIEVGIGEGAAASVDADSQRASVRDTVSSPAAGPTDTKVSVYARTRHGDIVVRRAEG